jgi:hypothetical protein
MRIADGILSQAKHLAARQGSLAASPATLQGNQVLLCAAACLAYAGFEERAGKEAARKLAERLVGPTGSAELYTAFDDLGWGRDLCRSIRQDNDFQGHSQRLAWFQSLEPQELIENAHQGPDYQEEQ